MNPFYRLDRPRLVLLRAPVSALRADTWRSAASWADALAQMRAGLSAPAGAIVAAAADSASLGGFCVATLTGFPAGLELLTGLDAADGLPACCPDGPPAPDAALVAYWSDWVLCQALFLFAICALESCRHCSGAFDRNRLGDLLSGIGNGWWETDRVVARPVVVE
jgi:hypothetical protein